MVSRRGHRACSRRLRLPKRAAMFARTTAPTPWAADADAEASEPRAISYWRRSLPGRIFVSKMLQPLQFARCRPVEFRRRRTARLSELQLLARALLVATSHGVHADEEGSGALAVGTLGAFVGFSGDLEFAGA